MKETIIALSKEETFISCFVETCDSFGYGFITDGKGEYHSVPMLDMPRRVSSYWSEVSTLEACRVVIRSLLRGEGTGFRFTDFSNDFYENLWNAQEDILKLFIPFMVNLEGSGFSLIQNSTNEPYINQVVRLAYTTQESTYHDTLTPLLLLSVENTIHFTIENLVLMCEGNQYALNNFSKQKEFKDYIEQYYRQHIPKLKVFWKKINPELIRPNPVIEEPCTVVSFDKTFIYNISLGKNIDFFEQRLKAINAFLNKKSTQQVLGIKRFVFDGIQSSQDCYRYFIIGAENNSGIKHLLENFVFEVLAADSEKIPHLKTILNYLLLKAKLNPSTGQSKLTKI